MKTLLVSLLFVTFMAGGLPAQNDKPAANVTKLPKRSDLISYEEIQATTDARDAFELVRRLRPNFLNVRATGNSGVTSRVKQTDILVYVNGAERGPLETLRTIPAHAVLEIRKLSAADAVTQFGKDQNGVIMVRVMTGNPP
jgi:Tfp pilus assembly pilus retraction ATPase PilT